MKLTLKIWRQTGRKDKDRLRIEEKSDARRRPAPECLPARGQQQPLVLRRRDAAAYGQ